MTRKVGCGRVVVRGICFSVTSVAFLALDVSGQGYMSPQAQPANAPTYQQVMPMSPQDRLRTAGRALPQSGSPGYQSYQPPAAEAQPAPTQMGPGPGQLAIPPREKPKVVGKGYIRYSYKGGAVEPPREEGAVTSTPQGRLYVIVNGDCLWNLAGTFYSDPWRWRDIWERNRYIENPDLIYPGRELLLGEQAQQQDVIPEAQPLDSSYLNQPVSFSGATAGFLDDTSTGNADSILLAQKQEEELRLLNSIIKRKILTSEFLATSPFLWSTKDARGLIYPGDARIDPRARNAAFQQFEEIPIAVFGKTSYQVGDTIEIYRSERMVTFKKRKANLVRRVAQAYVIEVKGAKMKAVLHEVWDAVKPGDRVGRAQPFPRMAVMEYVTPSQAISAQVFQRVEQTLFPYPFHSFIIDRGTADGVQVGDLFVAYQVGKEASPNPAQLACAVHVEGDYATLATVMLYQNALKPGDRVDLVRRMQSQ